MARILVADDEAPMRALIASGLRLDGHDVLTVADATAAADALRAQRFDLLVFDLFHSSGSAYDALAEIREDTTIPHLPVVVLSNEGDAIDIEREAALGVLDHVQKPFGFRELEDSIRRILSATPDEIEVMLDIRDEALQAYRDSLGLIRDVRDA